MRRTSSRLSGAIAVALSALLLVLPLHQASFASDTSSDTSLSSIQVNGANVSPGQNVDLAAGTKSADVSVEPTDPNATFAISGASNLHSGSNAVDIAVTASDTVTVSHYGITLTVAANSDISLSTFTVNGDAVTDGSSVDLPYGTSSAAIVVVPTSASATYQIVGNNNLVTGSNSVIVEVTAQNGTTFDYTVTLNVLQNDDTSLSVFKVNNAVVADGDSVELAPYTTAVNVSAVTSDPYATLEIQGATDLQSGDNTLTVTVTAADGVTSTDYNITLTVDLSDNTDLTNFTVNGSSVIDGSTVDLAYGTDYVDVEATTADANATYEVTGDTGLDVGDNTLVLTVIAADLVTTTDYTVTLTVAANDDTSLATFQVNGEDVTDGSSFDLPAYTDTVDVTAEPTDPEAVVEVIGDSDLQSGDNALTVTVTAADGVTSTDYNVTLTVALSDNTDLAGLTVNGTDVSDGDTLDLDWGTATKEPAAPCT